MQSDRRVGTGLPQSVPIFSQVHVHFGLRPERFDPAQTSSAFQANVAPLAVRINSPPAMRAFNINGNESVFAVTFPNESKTIIVSRDFHFFSVEGNSGLN
jgi:hypothetical protein